MFCNTTCMCSHCGNCFNGCEHPTSLYCKATSSGGQIFGFSKEGLLYLLILLLLLGMVCVVMSFPICPAGTLAPVTVVDKLEFRHLKAISEEVGRNWKMLGRYLGLDEATLDSIHQAHFSDLKEASYQALLRYAITCCAMWSTPLLPSYLIQILTTA